MRLDTGSAPRESRYLPAPVLAYTLALFTLFSLYWTLDIYFLWAEFHSLSYRLPVDSTGFGTRNAQSWKGASWINQDGLLPQYFAPIYVQYIVQLTLVKLSR